MTRHLLSDTDLGSQISVVMGCIALRNAMHPRTTGGSTINVPVTTQQQRMSIISPPLIFSFLHPPLYCRQQEVTLLFVIFVVDCVVDWSRRQRHELTKLFRFYPFWPGRRSTSHHGKPQNFSTYDCQATVVFNLNAMVKIQQKCCLLDRIERSHWAPLEYNVRVLTDDEFQLMLSKRLSEERSGTQSDFIEATKAAECISLVAGSQLYKELLYEFDVSKLSRHTKHFLSVCFQSGWDMVSLKWQKSMVILVKDPSVVASFDVWSFQNDSRALTLDDQTTQMRRHFFAIRSDSPPQGRGVNAKLEGGA